MDSMHPLNVDHESEDEEYQEQLQRAIQLSMEGSSNVAHDALDGEENKLSAKKYTDTSYAIDVDDNRSDSKDDDVVLLSDPKPASQPQSVTVKKTPSAVAESLAKRQRNDASSSHAVSPSPSAQLVEFGGKLVDRKAMEEERRARVRAARESTRLGKRGPEPDDKDKDDDNTLGEVQGTSTTSYRPGKRMRSEVSDYEYRPAISRSLEAYSSIASTAPQANQRKTLGNIHTLSSLAQPINSTSSKPHSTRSTTSPQLAHRPVISSHPLSSSSPSSGHNYNASEKKNTRFWKGTVKKTWIHGRSRTPDDITIQEVLQSDELKLAIICSFQWDDEWMLSLLDLRKVNLLCVAFAADEEQKLAMISNAPSEKVQFCFPPMRGPGNMHPKLQLLKLSNCLRIVVPTGNMVSYDWGRGGLMENMVFLIDLPLSSERGRNGPKTTEFGCELTRFLKALGLAENIIASLDRYDFSATRRLGFVHSIHGASDGDAWDHTGFPGLSKTVRALGLETNDPITVDYICSSLGNIKPDLLASFYTACQGKEVRPKKRGDTIPSVPDDSFRVYFPSQETIQNTAGGPMNAGTICFQSRWWESPSFPKHILYDCVSNRERMLMHNKLIYVRDAATHKARFAYVGSHNFSESAWGSLTQARDKGTPKTSCRNWECGVLLPVEESDTSTSSSTKGIYMRDVFSHVLPVPIKEPSASYTNTNVKLKPWFNM